MSDSNLKKNIYDYFKIMSYICDIFKYLPHASKIKTHEN
jgi:hypothetical protein